MGGEGNVDGIDVDERSSRKKIASHLLRVCIKGLESKHSIIILERSLLVALLP